MLYYVSKLIKIQIESWMSISVTTAGKKNYKGKGANPLSNFFRFA